MGHANSPTGDAHIPDAATSLPDSYVEVVIPDTDQPRTVEELARAFGRIGRKAADEDATLSSDPDDYPLFVHRSHAHERSDELP